MAPPTDTAELKPKSIREIAESPNLNSIPANYAYFSSVDRDDSASDHHGDYCDSVPVIDFNFLKSGTPHQRSQVIQDLGQACQQWGFFMVVNHGIPESVMKSMLDKCKEFFDLTAEEKQEFEGKHVLDPIRCGTSFNISSEKINFWRDYLKLVVHPRFHCPSKPHAFREVSSDFCKHLKQVEDVILRGISVTLGLNEFEIHKSLNLEAGQQILAANYYPPCPQPDLAIGLPPHTDHGLLTFLIYNEVAGLEIARNGKWMPVRALPNSIVVNIGDHLEIFSNGKYKSILHRAVVNSKATRISVGIAYGPALDAIVGASSLLINNHGEEEEENVGFTARYKAITYREFLHLQQSNPLNGKSVLNVIKV